MFGLGLWELVLLVAVIAVIFGAGKLPAWGDGLGRSVKEFRSATRVAEEPTDQADGQEPKAGGDLLTDTVLPELKRVGMSRLVPRKLRWLSRLTGPGK